MQALLFTGLSAQDGGLQTVRVGPGLPAWQHQARRLLREGIAPERVQWETVADAPLPTDGEPAAVGARVPRQFLDIARSVSCHHDPDRWSLLYQALWRVTQGERHLLQLHADPLVTRLNAASKSVLRDAHKMKAFVRFRAIEPPDAGCSGTLKDHSRYVAWFEPDHHIVEFVSGFFRRRFTNMRWSILTPQRCAHWEGEGSVWFTQGVARDAAAPQDAFEDAWRIYYRSIFNPARVKLRAMMSEMPQKYWRNLPEAELIPALVQSADRRVSAMHAQRKTVDQSRCGPRPPSPEALHAERLVRMDAGSAARLAMAAAACRQCGLGQAATQVVWGEGAQDARIMVVGEQPGDREDLVGRPFVGPAGQLLDKALAQAGLDRATLYLTNTVKHFKFKRRGKRRLHDKPSDTEVLACRPWLQAEMDAVRPGLVVCLGATAASAQLGGKVRMGRDRGRLVAWDGRWILMTYHPAYLLRLGESDGATQAYAQFVNDLRLARQWLDRSMAPAPTLSAASPGGHLNCVAGVGMR